MKVRIPRMMLTATRACEVGFDFHALVGKGDEFAEVEWTALHEIMLQQVHPEVVSWLRAHRQIGRLNAPAADCSGLRLVEADFRYANLAGASFRKAVLARARFGHANLIGADFTGADLTGVDFSKASIAGARFDDAVLADADFDEAIR